jgi:diguanylate cyclase (GGDEF)-like protein
MDGLTGLKNHRAFQERLREEYQRAIRYGMPLSIVLLDVDHFKQYNDTFGHPEGDMVLRRVAQILQGVTRECDMAARYGGEEFVFVLPQTEAKAAQVVAERCRMQIEAAVWDKRAITASFGVASISAATLDSADLIAQADAALYAAKTQGRNRVALSTGIAQRNAITA